MAFRAFQPKILIVAFGTFGLGECARNFRHQDEDAEIGVSRKELEDRAQWSLTRRRRTGRVNALNKLSHERRECKARDDFDMLLHPPVTTVWKEYPGHCLNAGNQFEIGSPRGDSLQGCRDACVERVMCTGVDFYADNPAGKRCVGWDGSSPKSLSPCSASAHLFEAAEDVAVRMVLPGLPVVGDMHLVLDKIQVNEIDLELTLSRVSGSRFRFTIGGVKGARTAVVDAWFEGLSFEAPQSSFDEVASGFATFEHIAANIATFGLAGDHGRMDRGPVHIDFAMSADFDYNVTSGAWDLVNGTQKQEVDIKIGNGGILMTIVNKVLDGAGGIDQIFFDAVWPLIQSLMPTKIGAAMKDMPDEQKVTHKIAIEGKCPPEDVLKHSNFLHGESSCPTDKLRFNISERSSVFVRPEPILKEFLKNATNGTKDLIERTLEAYVRGDSVLSGLDVSAGVDVDLQENNAVRAYSSPRANLPFALLAHIAPGVELEKFTDLDTESIVRGSLSEEKGVWIIPELEVENIVLPLAGNESIHFSGGLADIRIEVEADSDDSAEGVSLAALGDASQQRSALKAVLAKFAAPLQTFSDDLIFGHNTPLTIASGFDITLARDTGSIILSPTKGAEETLEADLHPDYITEILADVTKSMAEAEPLSARNESVEEPDGLVPLKYRKPWPTRRPLLDIANHLTSAKVHADVSATASMDADDHEMIKMEAGVSIEAVLKLGSTMWQFILQDKKDMGYLHDVVAGTFGELSGKTEAGKPAVLRLSCGILTIYYAEKEYDTDFEHVKKVVDLADPDVQYRQYTTPVTVTAQSKANAGDVSCVKFGTDDRYFCADPDQIQSLLEAYDLQERRLIKANTTWEDRCKHRSQGDETCPGRPDGSWFKDMDIYDPATFFPQKPPGWAVHSPAQIWKRAILASSLKDVFTA